MNIKMDAATLANTKGINKPNEDYCPFDEALGAFILLDGVSRDKENGIYPYDSPSLHVSEIFADFFMEQIKHTDKDLKKIFLQGNMLIKEYNDKLRHEFPAGTVGIGGYIDKDTLYYAYIGDCYGWHIHGDIHHEFTKIQTREVAAHKKELTTKQIRYEICNNIGHPYGYGVLDGNPGAGDFIETGKIHISGGDKIFLFSDGAYPAVEKCKSLEDSSATGILTDRDENGNVISGLDDQTLLVITFSV